MGLGFPLLFSLNPGPYVVAQLLATLLFLFLAYSIGSILLYGRSATLALKPEPQALLTLAAFREGGTLTGVLIAAIAPAAFLSLGASKGGDPAFGFFLGALAIVTAIVTLPLWRRPAIVGEKLSLQGLANAGALRLLALVNSLPVSITSTPFLFFVEDRLKLPGLAGPLLLLFFLSAGASLPVWTRISQGIGTKRTLMISMPLAIAGFAGTAFLPAATIADAPLAAQPLLEAVRKQIGSVPNLFRVLANSPAALEGCLDLSTALGKGSLPAATRERVALAVAQINGCDYCLAAHSFMGKTLAKLDDPEIEANRHGHSNDPKAYAAVHFAAQVTKARGLVSDEDLHSVRLAGYDDAQVVEIVMHVALNTWTSHINSGPGP